MIYESTSKGIIKFILCIYTWCVCVYERAPVVVVAVVVIRFRLMEREIYDFSCFIFFYCVISV